MTVKSFRAMDRWGQTQVLFHQTYALDVYWMGLTEDTLLPDETPEQYVSRKGAELGLMTREAFMESLDNGDKDD